MRRLLLSPAWPGRFRTAASVAAVAALAALFGGDDRPEQNAGIWLLWLLWWPLAAIGFPAAGRIWCAACPAAAVADRLDRLPFPRIRPPAFLGRAGFPLSAAVVAGFYFLLLRFGFEEDVAASRALLAALAAVALATALAFRGRVWCRSLCPAGALGGMLAPLAGKRVSFDPGACRDGCAGAACGLLSRWPAACATVGDPAGGIPAADCTLCGNCLKGCPSAFALRDRDRGGVAPGTAGEAAGALLLAGIGLDAILVHLRDWPVWFWRATGAAGIESGRWTELAVHAAVALFPAASAGAVAGAFGRFPGGFRRAGAAALPLAASAIAAAALRALLLLSPVRLAELARPFSAGAAAWLDSARRLDGAPLLALQAALVATGLLAAWRGLSASGDAAPPSRGARIAERLWTLGMAALLLFLLSRPSLA